MIWSWIRRHPLAVDVALVVALLAVGVGAGVHHDHSAGSILLEVAATLPLLVRRRWPPAVLAAVTAASLAVVADGYWFSPFQLGVALYTVASEPATPARHRSALASIAAVAVTVFAHGYGQFGDAASRVVFLVAAWLLGDSLGSRRAYVREIEEKAERLERERQTEARRAAAEEQARIARELHDVIAHALSVIVVQAGAADDVFEVDPKLAREPIRAIDTAARTALADLRRVLGLLQHDAGYAPQPGLRGLDELVGRVRATGLQVALEVEGAPRRLPAAVDLSAYRIVQEALTNTLKHAGAEHVHVHVRYGAALLLEVRDDGRGGPNGNEGNDGSGLIGMRERVALLGGTLEAGAAPGGGYRVAASLPAGEDV
jgi:signal transduction histidine kinase